MRCLADRDEDGHSRKFEHPRGWSSHMLGTILLIILILIVLGAFPRWPHGAGSGYGPSGIGTRLGTACVAALMCATAALMFSDAADAARARSHASAAPALDAQAVNG